MSDTEPEESTDTPDDADTDVGPAESALAGAGPLARTAGLLDALAGDLSGQAARASALGARIDVRPPVDAGAVGDAAPATDGGANGSSGAHADASGPTLDDLRSSFADTGTFDPPVETEFANPDAMAGTTGPTEAPAEDPRAELYREHAREFLAETGRWGGRDDVDNMTDAELKAALDDEAFRQLTGAEDSENPEDALRGVIAEQDKLDRETAENLLVGTGRYTKGQVKEMTDEELKAAVEEEAKRDADEEQAANQAQKDGGDPDDSDPDDDDPDDDDPDDDDPEAADGTDAPSDDDPDDGEGGEGDDSTPAPDASPRPSTAQMEEWLATPMGKEQLRQDERAIDMGRGGGLITGDGGGDHAQWHTTPFARGEVRDAERSVQQGTGGGHTDPADFEARPGDGDIDALKLAGGGLTDPVDEGGIEGGPEDPLGGGVGTTSVREEVPDGLAALGDDLLDTGGLTDRIDVDALDDFGE